MKIENFNIKYNKKAKGSIKHKGEKIAELEEIDFSIIHEIPPKENVKEYESSESPYIRVVHGIILKGHFLKLVLKGEQYNDLIYLCEYGEYPIPDVTMKIEPENGEKITLEKVKFDSSINIKQNEIINVKFRGEVVKSI